MEKKLRLGRLLPLERCPHCNVAIPSLTHCASADTSAHGSGQRRRWACYSCASCGGVTLAVASLDETNLAFEITDMWPAAKEVSDALPERAAMVLRQALDSLHAPSAAVMLAASAVDAMLKARGFKKGTLSKRIKEAEASHLITADMAAWAHEVRLDANEQRHSDEDAPLPDQVDARKAVDFAIALGDFLFTLPAQVSRGRALPP